MQLFLAQRRATAYHKLQSRAKLSGWEFNSRDSLGQSWAFESTQWLASALLEAEQSSLQVLRAKETHKCAWPTPMHSSSFELFLLFSLYPRCCSTALSNWAHRIIFSASLLRRFFRCIIVLTACWCHRVKMPHSERDRVFCKRERKNHNWFWLLNVKNGPCHFYLNSVRWENDAPILNEESLLLK